MNAQGVDLKRQINSKKEELNWQVKDGINERSLKKSQELDELIVKYMLMNVENLK